MVDIYFRWNVFGILSIYWISQCPHPEGEVGMGHWYDSFIDPNGPNRTLNQMGSIPILIS